MGTSVKDGVVQSAPSFATPPLPYSSRKAFLPFKSFGHVAEQKGIESQWWRNKPPVHMMKPPGGGGQAIKTGTP